MKGLDEKITGELVAGILNVIEEKVIRIVLYGSVARETDTKESDVDVALLLTKSMDKDEEEKLSEFIVDMNLKYDKVFSVIDIEYNIFCEWKAIIPFYINMEKEGIILWEPEVAAKL